jgi:hypothetical protein
VKVALRGGVIAVAMTVKTDIRNAALWAVRASPRRRRYVQ